MSQPYVPRPADARFDPRFDPLARPGATPVRTSTTGAKILTGIGALFLLLALVLVVVGIDRLADTVSEDALEVRPGADVTAEAREDVPGPALFTAERDTRYAVLFIGPAEERIDDDDLVVTGPDGAQVGLAESNMSYSFSAAQTTTHVATFESDAAGSYTVSVTGTSATARGDLAIIDDELIAGLVVGAVSGVLIIVAGVFAGILGVGLLIGGAVWWGVRRSAAKAAGLQA